MDMNKGTTLSLIGHVRSRQVSSFIYPLIYPNIFIYEQLQSSLELEHITIIHNNVIHLSQTFSYPKGPGKSS